VTEATHETKAPAKQAVAKTLIDMDTASAKLEFAHGHTLTVSMEQLTGSPVAELVMELALKGAIRELVTAYGPHRDNAHAAYEAASKRLADLLANGVRRLPGESSKPHTALESAIEAFAEATGKDVAVIRSAVTGWTDKQVTDAKGVVSTQTGDEQRSAFLSKVKTDPLTAALYATKRSRKPKAAAPSLAESFGL
jgi:hypothetical protein